MIGWINKLLRSPEPGPGPQYSDCVVEGSAGPFVLGKALSFDGSTLKVACSADDAEALNERRGKSSLFVCGFCQAVAFVAVVNRWKYMENHDEMPYVMINLTMEQGPLTLGE